MAEKSSRPRKAAAAKKGGGAGGGGAGAGGVIGTEGEQRTGPIAGTALVSGETFRNKGLQYANVDGLAMFEGDIILGHADKLDADIGDRQRLAGDMARFGVEGPLMQFSVGITGGGFRWPGAQVPFEIDTGLPNQQRVTDAIAHWEAKTRIRFVKRTSANSSQHANFVRFVPAAGCSSHVGRQQVGGQPVNLGVNCTTGNTIHEIGHALGLWHEQSREDRDLFVTIHFENVDSFAIHNFNQHVADGDDLGAYDYGSIMHYPRTAFSKNGQDTIVPVQAGAQIGQREGLSPGDIAGIHAMYPARIKVNFKKVLDDPRPALKKVRDDPVFNPGFKKVADDPVQRPPVFRPPFRGPLVGPMNQMGMSPFMLATPHHAFIAQAPPPMPAPAPADQLQAVLGEYEQAIGELSATLQQTAADLQAVQSEYAQVVAELEAAGAADGGGDADT